MAERVPIIEFTDERRGQIIRLLQTLDDGLPGPQAARLGVDSGFVHGREYRVETCPDCLANGKRMPRCETCGGRGVIPADGPGGRDPYDTGVGRGWMGAARHEAAKARDAQIDRLEAQTAPPQSEADLTATVRGDAWELERRRLRAQFDYGPLVRGLEVLREVDADACHALHAVHVYGWMQATTPSAEELVERGVQLLSPWLPLDIRAPLEIVAAVRERPVKERNRELRRREKEGATSQWLAREFELSVSQINRILAGEEDPD